MSVINIIKLMMASTLTCMVYACDFTEKNIDPNSPTSIEPGPLLTYTQSVSYTHLTLPTIPLV